MIYSRLKLRKKQASCLCPNFSIRLKLSKRSNPSRSSLSLQTRYRRPRLRQEANGTSTPRKRKSQQVLIHSNPAFWLTPFWILKIPQRKTKQHLGNRVSFRIILLQIHQSIAKSSKPKKAPKRRKHQIMAERSRSRMHRRLKLIL